LYKDEAETFTNIRYVKMARLSRARVLMSRKRKLLLLGIVAVLVGVHAALFAAGGSWCTVGLVLVGVDIVSGLFVAGAVREFKKLDAEPIRSKTDSS